MTKAQVMQAIEDLETKSIYAQGLDLSSTQPCFSGHPTLNTRILKSAL